MPGYRTKDEIRMVWRHSRLQWDIVIPKHTRCRKITEGGTAGRFWVDDLTWIDQTAEPLLHWDADHYGIDLDPALVEETA